MRVGYFRGLWHAYYPNEATMVNAASLAQLLNYIYGFDKDGNWIDKP